MSGRASDRKKTFKKGIDSDDSRRYRLTQLPLPLSPSLRHSSVCLFLSLCARVCARARAWLRARVFRSLFSLSRFASLRRREETRIVVRKEKRDEALRVKRQGLGVASPAGAQQEGAAQNVAVEVGGQGAAPANPDVAEKLQALPEVAGCVAKLRMNGDQIYVTVRSCFVDVALMLRWV